MSIRRALLAAVLCVLVVPGCRGGRWGGGCTPKTVVPDELADDQALTALSGWDGLPVLAQGRYRQQSSEDRLTGAPVPLPLWRNGNRDMNNFICASDDAEPGRGDGEFVLDQPRCAESYVQGYVVARFEGSGRLSRIWLTAGSLRTRPADREIFRLYVDDRRAPLLQTPLSRLLDGSAGEMFGRPFGAGATARMAWYYPVVFGSKLIVTLDRLDPKDLYFHQTSVVLDEPARARAAATSRLPQRDGARSLLRSEGRPADVPRGPPLTLQPAESRRVHDLAGPATVVDARVRVGLADVARLGEIVLQVRWDEQATPAIALPLDLLWATTQGVAEQSSLALGAKLDGAEVVLDLRLPMPFATRAEWTLSNRGVRPVELSLELATQPSVPAARWGHLHAQSFETAVPGGPTHPLASARGAGRLVGVCMMMAGHALQMPGMKGFPMNFLEGDERGMVDGVRAMAGTGTEDYFNGAFYFEDGPWAGPFAQVWAIEPGQRDGRAHVSACRWHVLGDAVDFGSSLDLEMEIGPADPSALDRYRSVAFLYLAPR
jgi:hypothetical protein